MPDQGKTRHPWKVHRGDGQAPTFRPAPSQPSGVSVTNLPTYFSSAECVHLVSQPGPNSSKNSVARQELTASKASAKATPCTCAVPALIFTQCVLDRARIWRAGTGRLGASTPRPMGGLVRWHPEGGSGAIEAMRSLGAPEQSVSPSKYCASEYTSNTLHYVSSWCSLHRAVEAVLVIQCTQA